MNLETLLVDKTKKSVTEKENSTAVKEAQKLLEYGTARDAIILRNIGLQSIHAKIEKEHGDLIIFNKIQEATDFSVIKIDHIKEVCAQFRMRYLPVNLYTGYYPPTVIAKIKQLEKNKTVELRKKNPNAPAFEFDVNMLQTKFNILAPPELFRLVEEEKPTVVTRKSYFEELRIKDFVRWMKEEPIFFYNEDDNNQILLEKWGNDFNIFRRVLGFFTSNIRNCVIGTMTSLLVILAIVGAFFMNPLISMGLAAIVALIAGSLIVPMSDSKFYTENNWNSRFKV